MWSHALLTSNEAALTEADGFKVATRSGAQPQPQPREHDSAGWRRCATSSRALTPRYSSTTDRASDFGGTSARSDPSTSAGACASASWLTRRPPDRRREKVERHRNMWAPRQRRSCPFEQPTSVLPVLAGTADDTWRLTPKLSGELPTFWTPAHRRERSERRKQALHFIHPSPLQLVVRGRPHQLPTGYRRWAAATLHFRHVAPTYQAQAVRRRRAMDLPTATGDTCG